MEAHGNPKAPGDAVGDKPQQCAPPREGGRRGQAGRVHGNEEDRCSGIPDAPDAVGEPVALARGPSGGGWEPVCSGLRLLMEKEYERLRM